MAAPVLLAVVLAPVQMRDGEAHHESGVADLDAGVEEVEREVEQRDLDAERDHLVCRGGGGGGYVVTLTL